jgi:hypothetical protein
MTDLEGRNFRLAGWIAEQHTKGTGLYRTGLFLSIKKPPDRRQVMEHLRYPNESTEYRTARNALLNDEIALRAQIETVAAKRRALPPGGKVSGDYVFERIGKNAMPEKVKMRGEIQARLLGWHPPMQSQILCSAYGMERQVFVALFRQFCPVQTRLVPISRLNRSPVPPDRGARLQHPRGAGRAPDKNRATLGQRAGGKMSSDPVEKLITNAIHTAFIKYPEGDGGPNLDYEWIPPEQSSHITKAILLDLEAGGFQIVKKA